jgi:uncharacterized protein YxeA
MKKTIIAIIIFLLIVGGAFLFIGSEDTNTDTRGNADTASQIEEFAELTTDDSVIAAIDDTLEILE